MRNITVGVLLALGGLACLSPLADAQWAPVPPPRYEAPPPPPPPGPRAVWRRGYWNWDGRDYVWVRGGYVGWRPGWRHWVPPHWSHRFGRPVWVPGHWA